MSYQKSDLLNTAIYAAKEAEKVILDYFSQDSVFTEVKKDLTPVTIADKKAEEVIKSIVSDRFPDHGFIGEESGDNSGDAEYVWTIDPIDGTKSFIRKIPYFSTEIGIMRNNELIAGVSNNPASKDMLYAEKGSGAFHNGQKVCVSTVSDIEKAHLGHGSVHYFEDSGAVLSLLHLSREVFGGRGIGDFWNSSYLAQGKIDIQLEGKVRIWDVAAKTVIIREAGGKATDFQGNPVDRTIKTYVATNSKLHDKVLKYLFNN